MLSFEFVSNLADFEDDLHRMVKDIQGPEMLDLFYSAAAIMVTAVKGESPVWRGTLRESFDAEAYREDEDPVGRMYSDLDYAVVMDEGIDPFFPNVEALEVWAHEHGLSPWAVAQAISRKGIKGKNFIEKVILASSDPMFDVLEGDILDLIGW